MGAMPCGVVQASDGMLYGTATLGGTDNAGMVFRLNPDGSGFTVLRSFLAAGGDGRNPAAAPLLGRDGSLYGTTTNGGSAGWGTVFRINLDGTGYQVLHHFVGGDEACPVAGLLEGSSGALFGVTTGATTSNPGAVFKLNPDGTGYTVLRRFTGTSGDGKWPWAALAEGTNGMLYGTTTAGGSANVGTVFRITQTGSNYAVLRSFSTSGSDGRSPRSGLLAARDGVLYGTTAEGGSENRGTVFKLNTDGTGYAVLRSLQASNGDGRTPSAALLEAADGMLYGSTERGGVLGRGMLFRLNKNGTAYTVLRGFEGSPSDGQTPTSRLVEGRDGRLYGTTLAGGLGGAGTVFAVQPDGTAHTILRHFNRSGGDGEAPQATVLEGSDGALYGTTQKGGVEGVGTVFRVNKDGTGLAVLWNFTSNLTNGKSPRAPLIEGRDGALYGTTELGGTWNYGTVFKLNKDGSGFTLLRSFGITTNDAQFAGAAVIEGFDGVLYGTTDGGGTAGCGTVFKLNRDGSGYAVLLNIAGNSEELNSTAALLQGSDGLLYGTTFAGGSQRNGSVFRLNTNGTGHSILRSFTGGSASFPQAALIEGHDGWLYGTASGATTTDGGVVFKMRKDGSSYSVLRTFSATGTDGKWPDSALAQGPDGVLYGTARAGGTNGLGTIFRLNTNGANYATVRSFENAYGDGQLPVSGLTLTRDGVLYGTTPGGGALGFGSIFRLGPPFENRLTLTIASGRPRLRFGGEPQRLYTLRRTPDFQSWTPVASVLSPIRPFVEFEDTNAPPGAAFYHVSSP
jgi:uncharacterized repeat protein (TIGR03803 family)